MTFIKAFFCRLLCSIGILALLPALDAIPLDNPVDSQPIYNHFGLDKVYKGRSGIEFKFHLSPFYQHASTSRNAAGTKVPGGDRLGAWNFFGLFFDAVAAGINPSLAPKTFNDANYKNMHAAQGAVGSITSVRPTSWSKINGPLADDKATPPVPGAGGATAPPESVYAGGNALSPYRIGNREVTTIYTRGMEGDITFANRFEDLEPIFGNVSMPTSYEKIGVRTQLNIDLAAGVGVSIRGGAVDIKNKPRRFIYDYRLQKDLVASGIPEFSSVVAADADAGTPTYTTNPVAQADAIALYGQLFSADSIGDIGDELNYNTRMFHKTSPEDLHIQVYWHRAVPCKDKTGDTAVTLIPYFAFGGWIPLSEKFDSNNAFAIPVSNQSNTFGLTADFSIGLDFPVLPKAGKETIGVSFGGGALMSTADTQANRRFPSSDMQQGLIPWTAGSVRREPGVTWYMNASLKAEEFVDGLSLYADYCYTMHEPDTLSVTDSDPVKQRLFQRGVARSQTDSAWKNQQVSAGFNYAITPNVAMNSAFQAHLSGVRVYRTVTLLGGFTVTF
ncbi:hypothetical protein FJ365_01485 [Candidatus Dependentiae bacterium]|nr:hypothetical protein [Candidatus Dependentiae bacterium]